MKQRVMIVSEQEYKEFAVADTNRQITVGKRNITIPEYDQLVEYETEDGKKFAVIVYQQKNRSKQSFYHVGNQDILTIGSGMENAIVFNNMGLVSKMHAVCRRTKRGWVVEDYSKNGVFVQGKRVRGKQLLIYGDTIELFGLRIQFLGAILGVQATRKIEVRLEACDWKPMGESVKKQREYVRKSWKDTITIWDRKNRRENVSFLAMHRQIGSMALELEERWKKNQVSESIQACIGRNGKGNKVYLNLHELGDGPHGLVAGTTGAGKSVLLQTLVLSLAISYSPRNLQFLLIDYKGGDMSRDLQQLPHVTGILSNLEVEELERGLAAIYSECRKRQVYLDQENCYHVDQYNGKVEEDKQLAHICIVVDEFAELIAEHPEFMDGLLKVSRLGRSLGIHLILATQKPAGVVKEHILCNTKFRICLRVQSKEDSMEVLQDKGAAFLKHSGQAILRTGLGEKLQQFRVAYAGGYMQNGKTELACLTQEILQCANALYGEEKKYLWLPKLSEKIWWEQTAGPEEQLYLGICDAPEEQTQFPFYLKVRQIKNGGIFGGAGKTNFLQTLCMGLCNRYSPSELWIYTCTKKPDQWMEQKKLPQMGGLISKDMDLSKLLAFLQRECEQRGKAWNRPKSPTIWVLMDQYEDWREMIQEWEYDAFCWLLREGYNYGIHFFLTANSLGIEGFSSSFREYLTHCMVLGKKESMMKQLFPGKNMPKIPELPGRGFTVVEERVLEFQTAMVAESEWKRQQGCTYKKKAKTLYLLPEYVSMEQYLDQVHIWRRQNEEQVPLGYDEMTGRLIGVPKVSGTGFLFTAKSRKDWSKPFGTLLCTLEQLGIKGIVLGRQGANFQCVSKKNAFSYYTEEQVELVEEQCIHWQQQWILVEDTEFWLDKLDEKIMQGMQEKQQTWILAQQADSFRKLRRYGTFRRIAQLQQGIFMGSGVQEQSVFETGIWSGKQELFLKRAENGMLFYNGTRSIVHIPDWEKGVFS